MGLGVLIIFAISLTTAQSDGLNILAPHDLSNLLTDAATLTHFSQHIGSKSSVVGNCTFHKYREACSISETDRTFVTNKIVFWSDKDLCDISKQLNTLQQLDVIAVVLLHSPPFTVPGFAWNMRFDDVSDSIAIPMFSAVEHSLPITSMKQCTEESYLTLSLSPTHNTFREQHNSIWFQIFWRILLPVFNLILIIRAIYLFSRSLSSSQPQIAMNRKLTNVDNGQHQTQTQSTFVSPRAWFVSNSSTEFSKPAPHIREASHADSRDSRDSRDSETGGIALVPVLGARDSSNRNNKKNKEKPQNIYGYFADDDDSQLPPAVATATLERSRSPMPAINQPISPPIYTDAPSGLIETPPAEPEASDEEPSRNQQPYTKFSEENGNPDDGEEEIEEDDDDDEDDEDGDESDGSLGNSNFKTPAPIHPPASKPLGLLVSTLNLNNISQHASYQTPRGAKEIDYQAEAQEIMNTIQMQGFIGFDVKHEEEAQPVVEKSDIFSVPKGTAVVTVDNRRESDQSSAIDWKFRESVCSSGVSPMLDDDAPTTDSGFGLMKTVSQPTSFTQPTQPKANRTQSFPSERSSDFTTTTAPRLSLQPLFSPTASSLLSPIADDSMMARTSMKVVPQIDGSHTPTFSDSWRQQMPDHAKQAPLPTVLETINSARTTQAHYSVPLVLVIVSILEALSAVSRGVFGPLTPPFSALPELNVESNLTFLLLCICLDCSVVLTYLAILVHSSRHQFAWNKLRWLFIFISGLGALLVPFLPLALHFIHPLHWHSKHLRWVFLFVAGVSGFASLCLVIGWMINLLWRPSGSPRYHAWALVTSVFHLLCMTGAILVFWIADYTPFWSVVGFSLFFWGTTATSLLRCFLSV